VLPTGVGEAVNDCSTTDEFFREVMPAMLTLLEERENESSSRLKFPPCRAHENFELE
jgi:hypothetical protein